MDDFSKEVVDAEARDHHLARCTTARARAAKKPYRNSAQACTAAGFVSKGREGVGLSGGFLRYRKIYMGNDRFTPEGAVYAQVKPAADNFSVARVDADVADQNT